MQANNPTGQTCPIASTRRKPTPAPVAEPRQNQANTRHNPPDRFIKLQEVLDRIGLSSTSLYNFIAQGRFPAQIKLGRTSVWSENAVNQWMEEQKRGGAK